MNALHDRPGHGVYSAWNSLRPINFYCDAPAARSVQLIGDFNHWNPVSLPMVRRVDGWWFLQVLLAHGHHRYRFLVDGKPRLDPQATGVGRDDRNEEASLVAVS